MHQHGAKVIHVEALLRGHQVQCLRVIVDDDAIDLACLRGNPAVGPSQAGNVRACHDEGHRAVLLKQNGVFKISHLRGGHVVAVHIRIRHDILLSNHDFSAAGGGLGSVRRFGRVAGALVPERNVAHLQTERSVLTQRGGGLTVQYGNEQRAAVHAAGQAVHRHALQRQITAIAVDDQRIAGHFRGLCGQRHAVHCDARQRPDALEIVDRCALVYDRYGRSRRFGLLAAQRHGHAVLGNDEHTVLQRNAHAVRCEHAVLH